MEGPVLKVVQRPVEFASDDTVTADSLIKTIGSLAADIVPEAPEDGPQRARLLALTQGANHLLASGRVRSGLQVRDLARASNYSTKHTHVGLDGTAARRWGAAATRLLSASTGPILVEHLLSAPVEVRRGSGVIGYDHPPGCSHLKPMIMLAGASIDRFMCNWEMPLTTATCWDHAAADADHERIAATEALLGHSLPGTFAEHLALAMDDRDSLRDQIRRAVEDWPDLFTEAKLEGDRIVRNSFSRFCVLEALPYGQPSSRGVHFADHCYPGDHPELIELVAAHMSGVAHCRPMASPAAMLRAAQSLPLDASLAAQLGLPISPVDTKVHAVDSDLLAHTAAGQSGARTTWWRIFGMDSRDPHAVALVEHAGANQWRRRCLRRAIRDLAPGLLYPKRADHRFSMRAITRVADAARVTAERQRRAGA